MTHNDTITPALPNTKAGTTYQLVDMMTRPGVYDFERTIALVDASDGRRLVVADGYCGQDDLRGGAYRWSGGFAAYVPSDATLDWLTDEDPNECGMISNLGSREVYGAISGHNVAERIARAAGIIK